VLPTVKFFLSLLALTLLAGYGSVRCIFITDENELNLTDRGKRIENSIAFLTSKPHYENLKITDGTKFSLGKCQTIINGDSLSAEDISTRGGSTLQFRRKSYSFTLTSDATFYHGKRIEKLKKFYALSLSMDKDYSSNRLAYEMMKKTGLFDLFYSFGEVHINGNCEGICMIIERPEDWALKKKNSPFIIRRGYNQAIDKMEFSKLVDRSEAQNFENYFKLIYKSLKKSSGEELYKTLSQWVDLDNYMKWLAFNFLVRNGDYTDEVFFYIDPGINKFRIIPWDYDDLFLPSPHEGREESREILGNKMIFSSEDKLDVKIATDPYLYKKYLVQLRETLEQLPASTLKEVFENTYAELYPYYSVNEIISMSKSDSHKETSLSNLKNDLGALYTQLITVYAFYLDNLKKSD
jgi:spore coat protein H